MGVIAFLSSITASAPAVANVAHLGGILVGYVFLKGRNWFHRYEEFQSHRRREELKRQFEVYYSELRHKIDDEKKPTIH